MNPLLGWALAALFMALSWQVYGWKGFALAVSVTVFWLLLQFNRAVRVMKNAALRPIGHVDSAVMLHAKLHAGLTMMQIVSMTHSLGERDAASGSVYAWTDASGAALRVEFDSRGRCASWQLSRPAEDDAAQPA